MASSFGRRRLQRLESCQQWRPQHPRCRASKFSAGVILISVTFFLLLLFQGSLASSPGSNNNPQPNNPLEISTSMTATPLVSNPAASATPIITASSSSTINTEHQNDPADAKGTTKKERKKKKKKPRTPPSTASRSSSSSLSSAQSIFVRRIQREWKDAVTMGIAYDWVKQKPIQSNKKEKNIVSTIENSSGAEDEDPMKDRGQTNENASNYLCLGPLGSNLFVWHFSILGVEGSQYEGGIYHGRLVLPPQYPASPPRVQVWTPSGRFVPLADICLSASAFHPESWKPSAWNLRTLVEGLRLHFITPSTEVGGMSATPEERHDFASRSRSWKQSFIMASSKKVDKKVVTVDHAKMIRQGMFPSVADPSTDEQLATSDSGDPVATAEDEIYAEQETQVRDTQEDDHPLIDSSLEQRATQVVASKKKQRRRHKRVATQEQPFGVLVVAVKRIIYNRHFRLAMVFLCIYKILFGVAP